MKKRVVLGVLPAVGISAIPSIACPACWPALVPVLGAVGLTFLTNRTYLLWANLAALVLALTILFVQGHENGYRPFLLGTAGAALVVLGKFVLASNVVAWSGFAGLILASALTVFGRDNARCGACSNTGSVVRRRKPTWQREKLRSSAQDVGYATKPCSLSAGSYAPHARSPCWT